MKRRVLLLASLLGISSLKSRSESTNLYADLEEFNLLYAPFYRKIHGCDPKETDPANCRESLGIWDQKDWEKVKRAARKVFCE